MIKQLDLVPYERTMRKAIPSLSRHQRDGLKKHVGTVMIGGKLFARRADLEKLLAGIESRIAVRETEAA